MYCFLHKEETWTLRGSPALGRVVQLEGELQEGLYAERVAMTGDRGELLFTHPEEMAARGTVDPWPKKKRKEQRMDKL